MTLRAFRPLVTEESEREGEERGEVVRDTIGGGGEKLDFRFWRFPGSARSAVRLVEVNMWSELIFYVTLEGLHFSEIWANIGKAVPDEILMLPLRGLHVKQAAHGGVGACGTVLQALRSRVLFPVSSLDFSTDLILPAAICP
jgi:hypothetical protein